MATKAGGSRRGGATRSRGRSGRSTKRARSSSSSNPAAWEAHGASTEQGATMAAAEEPETTTSPAGGWIEEPEHVPHVSSDPGLAALQRTTGMPLWSHVAWLVGALGLALTAYSYWWRNENWPDNFNPGGISGIQLGAGLFLLGLVAGLILVFVPWRKPADYDPGAGGDLWTAKAAVSHAYWRTSQILSWIGAGMAGLGLLLAVYAYSRYSPENPNITLLGGLSTVSNWGAAFLGFAAVGGILWVAFAVRSASHREALAGYVAAQHGHGGALPSGPTMAPPAGPGPAGVRPEELTALMKKVDGLLAALPDDVVSAFSKTKEAETYLKLLERKP